MSQHYRMQQQHNTTITTTTTTNNNNNNPKNKCVRTRNSFIIRNTEI
jgi:hypothetical protein